MSHNLRWDSLVLRVVSNANKMPGFLKRTCYSLTDICARKILCLSFVKSQLSYGSQVWSPTNDTEKESRKYRDVLHCGTYDVNVVNILMRNVWRVLTSCHLPMIGGLEI